MKIGIDIDTIRDINPRVIKYYIDNINSSYTLPEAVKEEDIDISKELKFKNRNEKNQFFHIDFPYEIYGCANPYNTSLPTNFNLWLKELENIDVNELKVKPNFLQRIFCHHKVKNIEPDVNVGLFGVMSSELIIGSTLFFLSKIGCRCRDIFFPIYSEKIYEKYDVIVTSNPKLVKERYGSAVIILINRNFNKKYIKKCNFSYNTLDDMINDKELINKLKKELYKI